MFLIRLKQNFPVAEELILQNGQEDFKEAVSDHCPLALNLGILFFFYDSNPSGPVKQA